MPPSDPSARLQAAALSDEALAEGILRRSEPHFAELYRRYFQRIYSFTYLRVRSHADTEELVQETFAVVFTSIAAFRGRSSLLSWIYGIARNTVNGHLRRARRREERFEQVREALRREPAPLASCTPEEQLLLRRYAEAINQRLTRVSRWQAEVFVMRHVEDLPIREIAQRTTRSSDSVRCSLYRVKKLLVDATLAGMVTARS